MLLSSCSGSAREVWVEVFQPWKVMRAQIFSGTKGNLTGIKFQTTFVALKIFLVWRKRCAWLPWLWGFKGHGFMKGCEGRAELCLCLQEAFWRASCPTTAGGGRRRAASCWLLLPPWWVSLLISHYLTTLKASRCIKSDGSVCCWKAGVTF